MRLPEQVEAWRGTGTMVALRRGHRRGPGLGEVFVVDRGAADRAALLVLHGFPGSTFEWRHVISDLAADHRVVACDLLGFGLSAKPADGDYSLFTQADRVEQVAAALDLPNVDVVLVAHDLGTTVAAELLHRQHEGELSFCIAGCVLTNGSIFIDLAELSDGQRALLALPDEPLTESLGSELLRSGLAATFPPGLPSDDELDAIVALVERGGGDLLLPRLIRYVDERRRHQPRWTAALAEADVPMAAVWGVLDPIAVAAMVDRLERLRAANGLALDVVRWPDGGHWPCIEGPTELAAHVRRWAARLVGGALTRSADVSTVFPQCFWRVMPRCRRGAEPIEQR